MQRRQFLAASTLAPAVLLPGIDAHASVEERRQLNRQALANSKLEIQRIGALHKAAGWSDPGLKAQLQSQAQVYAAHHRALAALA